MSMLGKLITIDFFVAGTWHRRASLEWPSIHSSCDSLANAGDVCAHTIVSAGGSLVLLYSIIQRMELTYGF